MKTAVGYIRVSTTVQVKEGFSLDDQEAKIRRYCEHNGLKLLKVYREEGVSGVKDDRPELNQLLKDAKSGLFTDLIVWRLDRFFRSSRHLFNTLEALKESKVSFRSINEQFDTSTPFGKAVLGILSIIAELEWSTIKERTYNGKINLTKTGKYSGGLTPYGYDYNKESKTLVINDLEARWVKKMFEMSGYEGYSMYKIQQHLHASGVQSKLDKTVNKSKTNGKGYWSPSSIARILNNESYTGKMTYYKGTENETVVNIPQIVSIDLYEKVKSSLKRNKFLNPRNAKKEYLFNGLIECGSCGHHWGGYLAKLKRTSKGKDYVYDSIRYQCHYAHKGKRMEICTAPSFSERKLDAAIWEKILNFLKSPEIILNALSKINSEKGNRNKEELKELGEIIKNQENRKKRLLDIYLSGNIDKNLYTEKMNDINIELELAKRKASGIEVLMMNKDDISNTTNIIHSLHKKVVSNLDSISYENKRQLIKMLVDKITIKRYQACIALKVPVFSSTPSWSGVQKNITIKLNATIDTKVI